MNISKHMGRAIVTGNNEFTSGKRMLSEVMSIRNYFFLAWLTLVPNITPFREVNVVNVGKTKACESSILLSLIVVGICHNSSLSSF